MLLDSTVSLMRQLDLRTQVKRNGVIFSTHDNTVEGSIAIDQMSTRYHVIVGESKESLPFRPAVSWCIMSREGQHRCIHHRKFYL